jgi:hypothetical protein
VILLKLVLLPLYLLAALIHHYSFGDTALESLITVLPAFIVGLIPAVLVYLLFMRSKWSDIMPSTWVRGLWWYGCW